jgi:minor extracellular serine protease Vpr
VTRRAGTASAAGAAGTQAFADRDQTTLNVGLAEFLTDLTVLRTITVRNDAPTAATFSVTATHPQGSLHQIALGATRLTVPARSQASVDVTITVPAATAGNSDDFRDFAGLITFTPIAGGNRGIALHVPYYGVPRASTSVATTVDFDFFGPGVGLGSVTNAGAAIAGTADLYSWGLQSPNDGHGRIDLRAAGVEAFDVDEGRIVVFGISTYRGWSTPETQEFDVLIDSDGDQTPDFDVFNVDFGLLVSGQRNSDIVTAILDLRTGAITIDFGTDVRTDGSTIRLEVLASSIGAPPTTRGSATPCRRSIC